MCSNVDIGDCFIVICVFECILLIIRPPPKKKKTLKSHLCKDKLEYFGDCFVIKIFLICLPTRGSLGLPIRPAIITTLYGTSSLNSLTRLILLFG